MTAEAQKKHRHRPSQELRITRGAIKPDWLGTTVVLIAGGPSLTKGQVNTVRVARAEGACLTLGINDAYRMAPWIDALYAADPQWWRVHIRAARDCHIPQMYCQDEPTCEEWGLYHIPGPPESKGHRSDVGISTNPAYIHFGGNSGFQALNLAVHLGAKRIVLLGYDMHVPDGGKRHWFGDHPAGLSNNETYPNYVTHFNQAAKQIAKLGIEVLNCSPGSRIKCWEYSTVANALWPHPAKAWVL